MPPDAPLLVFYDDQCGYCRWSVAQLLRLDREHRLRLIAIQSREGQRLLADVPAQQRLETAHLIDSQGRLFSGGAAAAPLADQLPALAWAAPLLRRFAAPVEGGYGWIAANRQKVGRLVSDRRRARADEVIAEHGDRYGLKD